MIDEFVNQGFVRIDDAFPRELADAGRELLWRDTGCDPAEPATWTRPVVRLGFYGQAPFALAATTPRLTRAFDVLVGQGRWLPRADLGTRTADVDAPLCDRRPCGNEARCYRGPMRTRRMEVALALLLPAASAAAQPGATAPAAPVVAAPVPGHEAGIRDDANSGRTWLSPTALTAPAGTFSVQSLELLIIGASYSFTDRFVMSVNTLVPIADDMPLILLTTLKLKVADLGRVKLAAHANLGYFDGLGIGEDEDDEDFGTAVVGGVATFCIDAECHSIFNAYLGAGFLIQPDVDQNSVPFLGSAAWVQRLGGRVKLVLEANAGFTVGDVDQIAEGLLAWYGLRFTSSAIGVDLGLVKPICIDCDDGDDIALGLPWLNFTFRAL